MPNKNSIDSEIEDIKEKLADIEHQRWADWQKYMHSKFLESSLNGGDGSFVALPTELFKRWQRQIRTPYKDLTDKEKASDMEQVDRYWPLIEALIQREVKKGRVEELKKIEKAGYDDMHGTYDFKLIAQRLLDRLEELEG